MSSRMVNEKLLSLQTILELWYRGLIISLLWYKKVMTSYSFQPNSYHPLHYLLTSLSPNLLVSCILRQFWFNRIYWDLHVIITLFHSRYWDFRSFVTVTEYITLLSSLYQVRLYRSKNLTRAVTNGNKRDEHLYRSQTILEKYDLSSRASSI